MDNSNETVKYLKDTILKLCKMNFELFTEANYDHLSSDEFKKLNGYITFSECISNCISLKK